MPTCYHGYITDVISKIRIDNPNSILDIGIGFGKWGFLFREYLDVMQGNVFKQTWKKQIDGIEIFDKYISDHQREIYDNIIIDNVLNVIDDTKKYDIIFTSDVLEHIEKNEALKLINKIIKKCKYFYAIIPMTKIWYQSQGSLYGNDAEAHISWFEDNDLKNFMFKQTYTVNKKPINFYIFKGELL